MNRLMIALTGVALCVGACKKSGPADTTANDMATNDSMAGDNMAANDMACRPTTAQGFVNAAAASDHFEIDSSKLAEAGTIFGGQIVRQADDHRAHRKHRQAQVRSCPE